MNLNDTATRLLQDYDARKPGTMFEVSGLNLSVEDAYDLQFEVAALRQDRGEQITGYKIGCISRTMQKQLGIDQPVFGHVWDSELSPTRVELSAMEFDQLAIEGEFAIRLSEDVPSSAWLRNNPEVISSFLTVIELHNYVFRGPESIRAVELITNNAIHAGVVLADEETIANDLDQNTSLQVNRNSENLGTGPAKHLLNGPLDIVLAVAEHLEQRGLHLKRNQIVLTGSPLPLWNVAPGDHISIQSDGLAEVSCTIVE